ISNDECLDFLRYEHLGRWVCNPESLYLASDSFLLILHMTAITSLPRYLLVLSILTLFLLPISVQSAPTPIDSMTIAADEPLNVILMIGDGMGFEHVELARLVEVGENGSLVMQQLAWNASVATYCADNPITDSAAAATAMATGVKTNKNSVGVDTAGQPLESILEYAQTLNKSTGIVSKTRLVDATPAGFMTHVGDRSQYFEIADQIITSDVDVLLGGGLDFFYAFQISTMASNGYSVVYNRTSMMNVTSGRIFGLFADVHMDYELDRNHIIDPSIGEMTNKSLELLSQDPDGFFLMVEAGRIDLAAHNDDKVRNALETIEFDEAIQIALDYVEDHNNTILIVTADHETEGLVVMSHNLNSTLPSSGSTHNEKEAIRVERVNNITVDWTATYHTAAHVPLYCYGTGFDELPVDMTIENTNIYTLMKNHYDGTPLSVVQYTPPVTSTTTTPPTTTAPPLDPTLLVVTVGVVALVIVAVLVLKKR
ncbi:MAG: alkaline phosphatase, partial [Candidatus Thorarchaeota archaeon]